MKPQSLLQKCGRNRHVPSIAPLINFSFQPPAVPEHLSISPIR